MTTIATTTTTTTTTTNAPYLIKCHDSLAKRHDNEYIHRLNGPGWNGMEWRTAIQAIKHIRKYTAERAVLLVYAIYCVFGYLYGTLAAPRQPHEHVQCTQRTLHTTSSICMGSHNGIRSNNSYDIITNKLKSFCMYMYIRA